MSGDLKFFLSTLQTSISQTSTYQEIFFFFLSPSGAGKFHTLEHNPGFSLPSRSYSEAIHCRRPQREKPDPLCLVQGLLEFVRAWAGREDDTRSRRTGKPRFPKLAPGCIREFSGKGHSCHGTRDAPQASSSSREKGARGRRLSPRRSGRSVPSCACLWSHPSPLQEVNQGLLLSALPPTPAFPYGLFTGPS